MKTLARFLVGVKKEMAKVKWPEKKDLIKYSIATVAVVLVFSAFFGLLDVILSSIKVVLH